MVLINGQAANPGCVLEDFIRWYSPRDWVDSNDDDDDEKASDGMKSMENDPKVHVQCCAYYMYFSILCMYVCMTTLTWYNIFKIFIGSS